MGSLWIYIRTMFEEDYTNKGNSFECILTSVERGSSECICISGAAINYIANEMKFCTKKPGHPNTWDIRWNAEKNVYFASRNSTDWNVGIPDLQSEPNGIFSDPDAQFCTIAPNGYTYIKIRDFEDIVNPTVNPKKLYAELEGKTDQKICLEFFIILAREFRTVMNMDDYVKMLFRFTFFLHPYSGIEILKQHFNDTSCRNFNTDLLEKYCQLSNQLAKIKSNPLACINAVSRFIDADITTLYRNLNKSKTQGDPKSINEFFQKQANITIKVAESSRFKDVMNVYKIANNYHHNDDKS